MVWAPRSALLPLGSVRGEEGLTIWEYGAFADACRTRYHSGDDEQEEEDEACFLFHEALMAEEEEIRCHLLSWYDQQVGWSSMLWNEEEPTTYYNDAVYFEETDNYTLED